jgi:hypothetical protein
LDVSRHHRHPCWTDGVLNVKSLQEANNSCFKSARSANGKMSARRRKQPSGAP